LPGGIFLFSHYPFENHPLPYSYNALEPYINAKTMQIHHDTLVQGFVDDLNAILKDKPNLQNLTLEQLINISGRLPKNIGVPISRNAGGAYSHFLYFDSMTPNQRDLHDPELFALLNNTFGSMQEFYKQFSDAAMSVFGSGYAWLVCKRRSLAITTTANQDTPLPAGLFPLLNIDVWEHAYFLIYYADRLEYINNFRNILNWTNAGKRYKAYLSLGTR